jgi:hypothetical protein
MIWVLTPIAVRALATRPDPIGGTRRDGFDGEPTR